MGKRKKSIKKSTTNSNQQQKTLETTDSSEDILLQSTDKLTPFVALHQNNLLPSNSPNVNEQTIEEANNHHHHHNNGHESKLLEAINKVDPEYAPHLQNHLHIHQHQQHDHDFVTSQDSHHHVYYVNDEEDIDEDDSESAKLYNKGEETVEAVDVTKRYEPKLSFKQRLKNFSIRDMIVKWRYSIIYALYLLFMSGLAAFLFGWAIYKRGKIEEIWFLALEGFCTFAICYECVLSVFLYRRQFYKKLIVWCNIFVSLSAVIIFSLLLYCFIEKEENYFWNNVAFAQEAVIGLHCCVNAFRIIVYILQIRRGGGIVRDNFIVLDVGNSTDNSRSPSSAHLEEPSEHRYGTTSQV